MYAFDEFLYIIKYEKNINLIPIIKENGIRFIYCKATTSESVSYRYSCCYLKDIYLNQLNENIIKSNSKI